MSAIRSVVIYAAFAASAAAQTFTITTNSLPSGTVNVAYSATVTATGGTQPYRWSAVNLPPGLVINNGSGVIAGTPTTSGTFSATVNVIDNGNFAASKPF